MHLLLDLDGTLSDPLPGISRCLNQVLVELGEPARPAEALRRYVGPPLETSFAELLRCEAGEVIEGAVRRYRRHYLAGGYRENRLYPGVREMLEEIADRRHLHLVTCKPTDIATRVLEFLRIDGLFHSVNGCTDGEGKASLVARVLEAEQIPVPDTWLAGDRADDTRAARANGLCAAMVSWGFGDAAEARAARPDALAHSPSGLVTILRAAGGHRSPSFAA